MTNPSLVVRRLLFGALALLAACATVDTTRLAASPRPMHPRPSYTVEVYVTNRPERAYVEVSVISVQEGGLVVTGEREVVLDQTIDEAARMGCDGIIILDVGDAKSYDGKGEVQPATLDAVCFVYAPPPESVTLR